MAIAPELEATAHEVGVVGWWRRVTTGDVNVIVPDGAADVLWSPGHTPWVAGPDTAPRLSSVAAGKTVVGVRLQPGALGDFVRDSVVSLADHEVGLDQVLGDASCRRLHDRLEHGDLAEAGPLLAETVDMQLDDHWRPDPIVMREIERLRFGNPQAPNDLSARQLRRRFTNAMGYGPKFFDKICRVDRFLELLAQSPSVPLAEAAVASGFHDQAHLTRTCRALTGRTPGQHRSLGG